MNIMVGPKTLCSMSYISHGVFSKPRSCVSIGMAIKAEKRKAQNRAAQAKYRELEAHHNWQAEANEHVGNNLRSKLERLQTQNDLLLKFIEAEVLTLPPNLRLLVNQDEIYSVPSPTCHIYGENQSAGSPPSYGQSAAIDAFDYDFASWSGIVHDDDHNASATVPLVSIPTPEEHTVETDLHDLAGLHDLDQLSGTTGENQLAGKLPGRCTLLFSSRLKNTMV